MEERWYQQLATYDVGQGDNACLINIRISTAKSFANSGPALLTTGNCAEVDEQSGMLKGKQASRYVKGRKEQGKRILSDPAGGRGVRREEEKGGLTKY